MSWVSPPLLPLAVRTDRLRRMHVRCAGLCRIVRRAAFCQAAAHLRRRGESFTHSVYVVLNGDTCVQEGNERYERTCFASPAACPRFVVEFCGMFCLLLPRDQLRVPVYFRNPRADCTFFCSVFFVMCRATLLTNAFNMSLKPFWLLVRICACSWHFENYHHSTYLTVTHTPALCIPWVSSSPVNANFCPRYGYDFSAGPSPPSAE